MHGEACDPLDTQSRRRQTMAAATALFLLLCEWRVAYIHHSARLVLRKDSCLFRPSVSVGLPGWRILEFLGIHCCPWVSLVQYDGRQQHDGSTGWNCCRRRRTYENPLGEGWDHHGWNAGIQQPKRSIRRRDYFRCRWTRLHGRIPAAGIRLVGRFVDGLK